MSYLNDLAVVFKLEAAAIMPALKMEGILSNTTFANCTTERIKAIPDFKDMLSNDRKVSSCFLFYLCTNLLIPSVFSMFS